MKEPKFIGRFTKCIELSQLIVDGGLEEGDDDAILELEAADGHRCHLRLTGETAVRVHNLLTPYLQGEHSTLAKLARQSGLAH